MNPNFRRTLAEAHIPVITIAILYFWSIKSLAIFVIDVVSVLLHPPAMDYLDPFLNFDRAHADLARAHALIAGLVGIAGAWVLSLSVHGVGPLELLKEYRTKLSRQNDA